MSATVLKAVKKTEDRNQDLRAESKVPATLYGPKVEAQSIIVDYQEFRRAIRANQLHKVFTLEVDGTSVDVIIRDFQRDPVLDTYTHIDFFAIDEKAEIKVHVPVSFEGESPALRLGAIFTVAMPTLKVKCLPKNIPDTLTASLEILKTDGDKIRVSDVQDVEGVQQLMSDNVMVAKTELSRAGKQAANAEKDSEGAKESAAA